jgi:hypothetical protein
MGLHALPAGSKLRNIVFRDQILFVELELLKEVVLQAINQVLCQKDDFLQALQTNIATVVKQGDTLSPEVIDERLRELQKELVKKANQKADYDAIADEILRLRDMRKQAEGDRTNLRFCQVFLCIFLIL